MPACRDQAVARASQSIAHRCGLPAKVAEKTILTCGVRIFLTGIKLTVPRAVHRGHGVGVMRLRKFANLARICQLWARPHSLCARGERVFTHLK